MRRLVIDSATEACSVGLFDGDDLVAGAYAMLGRGHAEQLVPMIAALPDKGRADLIAVNTGPGSFTGIRVGLAAARALSLAWAAPLAGYSSLALVAAMAQAGSSEARGGCQLESRFRGLPLELTVLRSAAQRCLALRRQDHGQTLDIDTRAEDHHNCHNAWLCTTRTTCRESDALEAAHMEELDDARPYRCV